MSALPTEEKNSKKDRAVMEREAKETAARKAAAKIVRKTRRTERIRILKSLNFKPNAALSKDKKTGKDLKGFFLDGTATPASRG